MRIAIGTSLFIIVAKSLRVFYKYIDVLAKEDLSVNWNRLVIFILISIMGSFLG